MSIPPTPTEIAERKAVVRHGWCDDEGVIVPVADRPALATAKALAVEQKPMTDEIHALLSGDGPATVAEIAERLGRDIANTRKAVNLKRDVLWRVAGSCGTGKRASKTWDAIPQ